MLYKYDEAICKDLSASIDPSATANNIVKMLEPESVLDIVAQIQEDKISFPLVTLSRNPDTPVDSSRMNFTAMHRGIASVYDSETNTVYLEKVLPIKLSYTLTVLATNTADVDEIVRELLFKYLSMYFLTIDLPYESDRKLRFGITLDYENAVSKKSANLEYLTSGSLYQTQIPLICEGAVLLSYTPKHVERFDHTDTVAVQAQPNLKYR